MTMPRNVLAAALLTLLLGLPPGAAARSDDALERAERVAEEALRLTRANDLEGAIARYREALDLAPDLHAARFALASLYAGISRFEEAREEFAAVLAADPDHGAARRGEATSLLLLGRWVEARRRLEDGFKHNPRDGQLAHLLARVLASAPAAEARSGSMALELAMRVYDVQKKSAVGETVAMAFAELGEFERASAIQDAMVKTVEPSGNQPLLDLMRERLAAYARQQPWRAKSPLEIIQSTELPAAGGP